LHRAVHIWVFNSRGEFLLHRRSATKDESPLCYTSSASGHLSAGEDYDTAGTRELAEELGLRGALRFLTKLPAGPETSFEHTVAFFTVSDDVPVPDAEEIDSLEFVPPAEVTARLTADPQQFSPPFRALWRWFQDSHAEPILPPPGNVARPG
jgi:16S rRNA (adenine1518-N6/adenine1519-N6)-dimethyltransferase